MLWWSVLLVEESGVSGVNYRISLVQSRYQKVTSRHYISETLNNNHSRIPSMNNGNTYQESVSKHRLYCRWCSRLKILICFDIIGVQFTLKLRSAAGLGLSKCVRVIASSIHRSSVISGRKKVWFSSGTVSLRYDKLMHSTVGLSHRKYCR
jgi:hypothetical protein